MITCMYSQITHPSLYLLADGDLPLRMLECDRSTHTKLPTAKRLYSWRTVSNVTWFTFDLSYQWQLMHSRDESLGRRQNSFLVGLDSLGAGRSANKSTILFSNSECPFNLFACNWSCGWAIWLLNSIAASSGPCVMFDVCVLRGILLKLFQRITVRCLKTMIASYSCSVDLADKCKRRVF